MRGVWRPLVRADFRFSAAPWTPPANPLYFRRLVDFFRLREPFAVSSDSESIYERIAPLYDLADGLFEHFRYRHIRPKVYDDDESEELLDCGVGTGRNIAYYPNAADGTFLFCVLPDQAHPPALRELARVLRPGGALVLLDYQMSDKWHRREVMRLWEPIVQKMYGARCTHRTKEHVRQSAFEVNDDRTVYSDIIYLIEATAPADA